MKNQTPATIYKYCGVSTENKFIIQSHPVNEVKRAKRYVGSVLDLNKDMVCYSNSTDFVSTIKHYGKFKGIKTEFFLDGVSYGDDIEPIFEDFNKSLYLIDEIMEEH